MRNGAAVSFGQRCPAARKLSPTIYHLTSPGAAWWLHPSDLIHFSTLCGLALFGHCAVSHRSLWGKLAALVRVSRFQVMSSFLALKLSHDLPCYLLASVEISCLPYLYAHSKIWSRKIKTIMRARSSFLRYNVSMLWHR